MITGSAQEANEGTPNPRIVVFSSLFPSPAQPGAGVFIRERMFRVAKRLPMVVVAPVPWFPFQGLLRRFRPNFRPNAPRHEQQEGIEVQRPRFFSLPGILKGLDGLSMALASWFTLARLRRRFRFNLIDAHFAYPDGYAATLLGRWFRVPVTITLRGTEVPLSRFPARRKRMLRAIDRASHVFSVADALRRHVGSLGADAARIQVVGNGVDTHRFRPIPKAEARKALDIPAHAPVLVSVGGLVERKGFHRVIAALPQLLGDHPQLQYLVVGGACAEGDWSARLAQQVKELGISRHVRFLGHVPPDQLSEPLSAADVFVLSTRNEGWANVFLEAMACGLPVVTTDVGGNREVVADPGLGLVVPFDDAAALIAAIRQALATDWDRGFIRRHAEANDWEQRVDTLCEVFERLVAHASESGMAGGKAYGKG
jgi:glycosyltransferase involved in cell wall biosynthesis